MYVHLHEIKYSAIKSKLNFFYLEASNECGQS